MLMSLVQPSPQLLLQFDKVLLMSKGSGTLTALASLRESERMSRINSHQTQCKTIGDGIIHSPVHIEPQTNKRFTSVFFNNVI
jgi:hypothetical protein